jgi:hypothetical protein
MNIEALVARIDASLQGDSRHAMLRGRFEAKRICPKLRSLTVEPHVAAQAGRDPGVYLVYFVTDDDPTNVFFDERCDLFGAAWGPKAETGQYLDLGARSASVLEMLNA